MKDRPKPGRPRVTNDKTNEQIMTTNRAAPMRQVLSYSAEIGVSARTVVRRLNGVGLYAHRPAIKPKLTANQKVKRLAWAKEYKRWNRAQWANVVFSDEATYVVDSSDRKIRCYRSKGERFNEDMILEKKQRLWICQCVRRNHWTPENTSDSPASADNSRCIHSGCFGGACPTILWG